MLLKISLDFGIEFFGIEFYLRKKKLKNMLKYTIKATIPFIIFLRENRKH